MAKIIIDNRSDISDDYAILLASQVIKDGRVSNNGKQYCYMTVFDIHDIGKIGVYSDLNKKSDKFTIVNQSK